MLVWISLDSQYRLQFVCDLYLYASYLECVKKVISKDNGIGNLNSVMFPLLYRLLSLCHMPMVKITS